MEFILDRVFALKNVDIFDGLPEQILADIAEITEVIETVKGQWLMRKGESGSTMYIVWKGSLDIRDGETLLAQLNAGDIVGEFAILAPVKRTADVISREDGVLFKLENASFQNLMYEEPEILKNILQVLVYRIIDLNKQISVNH